ncbi:ACT domain-containing protein [Actinomadura kijaniata]|uniref:ACT domain-containing protein n=1 Tax=Actinomadura kijaniata TaxID=46161 RepID=UPI003F193203
MSGETDLAKLLAGLDPELRAGEYVFVTSPDRSTPPDVEPLLIFEEPEGRTLVLPRGRAEAAGLEFAFPSAWIVLRIHSALEAVGMMAAISTALAGAGISCNVVSAYHHDHLFVPRDRADEAVAILRDLGHDTAR